MIYDDKLSGSQHGIMMDKIVRNPNYDCEDESYSSVLVTELGGVLVNKAEGAAIDRSHILGRGGLRRLRMRVHHLDLSIQWAKSIARRQCNVLERNFCRVYV